MSDRTRWFRQNPTRWFRQYRTRWFSRKNILLALLAFQLVWLLQMVSTLWQPPVNLAFLIPENEQISWERVRDSFEKSHPGIHIKLVATTATINEQAEIYKADFTFNQARYDLVYMDIIWTAEFSQYLTDLEELMRENGVSPTEAKKGFLKSEIEAGEFDGTLYRMPMRSDIALLFYRKDILEELGKEDLLKDIRTNSYVDPERLKDVVNKFKEIDLEQERTGYLWQGSSEEEIVTNFVEVLHSVGGRWTDLDVFLDPENVENNNSKAIDAATSLWEMIHKYAISPKAVTDYEKKDALNEFLKGNSIFLRGWPAFYKDILEQEELAGNVEISLPFSFGKDNPAKGCRGGWGFGIPKNASHPREAWEAVQYFTSIESQSAFLENSGYLPTRTALFYDEEIKSKYPHLDKIYDYLNNSSVFRPDLIEYTEKSTALQKTLAKILQEDEISDIEEVFAQINS